MPPRRTLTEHTENLTNILTTYQTVHGPTEYVHSGDHISSTRGAEYK